MIYLQDPDVTLHHGDVLETLRGMPDGSVDCVITSPPYWGLRDYGTGAWEGGDSDCDHTVGGQVQDNKAPGAITTGQRPGVDASRCRKCGATRQDQQLGLEATPDLFVARMVEVFREVRRVLAPYGTCWVNLGDSYAGSHGYDPNAPSNQAGSMQAAMGATRGLAKGTHRNPPNLKPKDLVGIPWRVAFALQADGWYLRSDIVWSKPNPMPESVTDRPTKAHEYVFLLTKQPRYFFDQEAVREPAEYGRREWSTGRIDYDGGTDGVRTKVTTNGADPGAGRNIRSVWEIATQPYPEAHFATYPEELVRRCLLAGCPEAVCRTCGKPRERIVEREFNLQADVSPEKNRDHGSVDASNGWGSVPRGSTSTTTIGWSDCGHADYRPGIVLDPFVGSGTTAHVARKHGRHAIGIDLSESYLELAARRLQQQSLFAEAGS